MQKRRLSWGAALSLMIIVVAATVCVTMLVAMRRFNAQVSDLSNRQAMYTYISDVDTAVRGHYYGTIDEEALRRAMAQGEIAGIGDPYAEYFTTEQYSAWQERMSGQSTGYGISVAADESGRVVITNVEMGSTGYSAGLQKGDIITAVNKTALAEEPLKTVQKALTAGMSVMLTVDRAGKSTAFELSSAAYTRVSVDSELLGATGYIRLRAITNATPEQLKSAYAALKEEGAEQLVLDLRGVDGGSFEAAQQILSFLMPYGPYGYYVDNAGEAQLRAEEAAVLDMPAAVLVNGKTAGEAELIAAALRQGGLVTLVGEQTAGRAMVQTCFALASDNAAVYITVGEMQLVDHTGWEGKGLTPDLPVAMATDQALDLVAHEVDDQLMAAANALTAAAADPAATTTATETTAAVETTATVADGETTTVADGATTTAAGETATTTAA